MALRWLSDGSPMALRWPAPAEPRAESGTAARTAGSRGGRPGQATTEVHRHARRYARRAGHAAGGRTDEQALGRHEPASRADRAAGAHRSARTARLGSTSRWADGAASRRGRCAPWPATGCATLGRFCQTPRACVDRSPSGLCLGTSRGGARTKTHRPSGAGGHSAGRSCIRIYISGVPRPTVTYSKQAPDSLKPRLTQLKLVLDLVLGERAQ